MKLYKAWNLFPEEKVYLRSDVDEAIAELKAKLETVNELVKTSKDLYDRAVESLKASHYAEMVDAGMRERRLRRALYKACANWAHAEYRWSSLTDWGDQQGLAKMERKCLKKAEEYK